MMRGLAVLLMRICARWKQPFVPRKTLFQHASLLTGRTLRIGSFAHKSLPNCVSCWEILPSMLQLMCMVLMPTAAAFAAHKILSWAETYSLRGFGQTSLLPEWASFLSTISNRKPCIPHCVELSWCLCGPPCPGGSCSLSCRLCASILLEWICFLLLVGTDSE